MIPLVVALVGVSFVIGLPLTALVRRVGRRLGDLDSAGAAGHEKRLRPVPNNGGIAICGAVAIPLAAGLAAAWLVSDDTWQRAAPAAAAHLPGVRSVSAAVVALLASMAALLAVGWIDDRRPLGPWPKLGVQVAVAAVMAIGFEVRLLELLPAPLSVAVTVVWIVVVINAINFLDNMDGLAGGVAAIAATFLMVACLVNGQWFIASTLALLVGALAAFLVFNFPPATIFMGDRGSLVVGFLLAVLTVRTTYYDAELGGGWYGVFMPLVVLAIPLYDFTSVTLIRLAQGRSPLVGDQQHFSHRLVQRGLSPRGAVVVIWSATAVTGVGGISLGSLEPWQAALVGLQTAMVLVMIALLEHASRHAASRGAP